MEVERVKNMEVEPPASPSTPRNNAAWMYSIERSKDNPSSPRIVLNVREIPGEDEWGKEAREARRKQEEEEERKYLEKKARKSKAKLVAKLRSEGKHNEADRLEKGELVESEPEKKPKEEIHEDQKPKEEIHLVASDRFIVSELSAALLGLSTGTIFGFALEKSKISLPWFIRQQMVFDNNGTLKAFLAATVSGLIVITIVEKLRRIKREPRGPISAGILESFFRGYSSNVIGGLCIGVGMVLSGACPGTVYSQLGMGVQNAVYTFMGTAAGTALFASVNKRLSSPPSKASLSSPKIPSVTGMRATLSSVFLATALSAAIVAAEKHRPFTSELFDVGVTAPTSILSHGLRDAAWSPQLAGIVLGLMQLPTFYFLGGTIGTSFALSGACEPAANVLGMPSTYLSKYVRGTKNVWQICLVAGITLGSYLSMSLSGVKPTLTNTSPLMCFVGGAFLQFGARLANGCTSGHGISGLANHSLTSFLTVACMFVGGIATSAALRSLQ